jgi:hypothetical protein
MTVISSLLKPREWHRVLTAGLDALAGPPADPRFLELATALGPGRTSRTSAGGDQ